MSIEKTSVEGMTYAQKAITLSYSYIYLPVGLMIAILITCGSIYTQEDTYFIYAKQSLQKVGVVAAIELILMLISGGYAYFKLKRAEPEEGAAMTFDSFTKALSTCNNWFNFIGFACVWCLFWLSIPNYEYFCNQF